MPEIIKSAMQEARARPLPYIVQIVGVVVVLINLFIASKLAPLAQDLAILANRVEAAEVELSRRQDYIDRFLVIEGEVKEMNSRLGRIENKIDVLIQK